MTCSLAVDAKGMSGRKVLRTHRAAAAVGAAFAVVAGAAQAIDQSGEQKDMRRVGHADLQGRAAYQPNFIRYPDGSVIAFVGTHSNTTDNGPRPNPLNGGAVEPNGTMIVDVTDPRNPVEKFHIPAPNANGSRRRNRTRMCLGSDLPGGVSGPRLPDAQRPDEQPGASRVTRSGTSPTSQNRCSSARCATFATPTSIGGSARPASPTCRAAKVRPDTAMAPGPVDDHRRLEQSVGADLPPHARVAGWTTERHRAGAAFAARCRSPRTSIPMQPGLLARAATPTT